MTSRRRPEPLQTSPKVLPICNGRRRLRSDRGQIPLVIETVPMPPETREKLVSVLAEILIQAMPSGAKEAA